MLLLAAVLGWPSPTDESTALLADIRRPVRVETGALGDYLDVLTGRGLDATDQGVRVESLQGDVIYADHFGGDTFNPASVMKTAVTLAALDRFGPGHRFETAFLIEGSVDGGTLHGELVLAGDGDPEMGTAELTRMARAVTQAGIRRVDGALVIAGTFTVGNLHRRDRVASHVVRTLARAGVRVPAEVRYGEPRGAEIVRRWSSPLSEIVFD